MHEFHHQFVELLQFATRAQNKFFCLTESFQKRERRHALVATSRSCATRNSLMRSSRDTWSGSPMPVCKVSYLFHKFDLSCPINRGGCGNI